MLPVLELGWSRHGLILVVALDLLVIVEAEEVFQFGEFFLMARHEIIHVHDGVARQGAVTRKQFRVRLLRLPIARQQVHLVRICHALEVTIVPLEDLEYLAGKFGIESLAAQLVLANVSLGEVFIVEVVHPSILLFRHISESVECLNIPIVAQSGEGVSTG